MEGRQRKNRPATSERSLNVTTDERKVPVVYYLCRNNHMEHPHFLEVPISTSSGGLYLRDVINRLNLLRGKKMAAMYSWSCKRTYKNGFVWHDLTEGDLILPAHKNEYVLKGSELFDACPPDQRGKSTSSNSTRLLNSKIFPPSTGRDSFSSPSSTGTTVREDEMYPVICIPTLSSGYPSPAKKISSSYVKENHHPCIHGKSIYNRSNRSSDASTQTEERAEEAKTNFRRDAQLDIQENSRACADQNSWSNKIITTRKNHLIEPKSMSNVSSTDENVETLESLIRAEAQKMNSLRISKEEEDLTPSTAKLKTIDIIMQLITCGSISLKDHQHFSSTISNVKLPSSMFSSSIKGELDHLSKYPRPLGLRLNDKRYFSGSLVETKAHKGKEPVNQLKRSSSYTADRNYRAQIPVTHDEEHVCPKYHSQTVEVTGDEHTKHVSEKLNVAISPRVSSDALVCNGSPSIKMSKGSMIKRPTDHGSLRNKSSTRLEYMNREETMRNEERLTSGARVIIQSKPKNNDINGSTINTTTS